MMKAKIRSAAAKAMKMIAAATHALRALNQPQKVDILTHDHCMSKIISQPRTIPAAITNI
jgi:hypothetical protein